MEVIDKGNGTWIIEDSGVRCFLLEGKQRAALIDTGMNFDNIKEVAESLTDKELVLFNTHADRDHIGGNDSFDIVHIGIHEMAFYGQGNHTHKVVGLYDKDIIDLGDRKLEVINLPGHTPGSIAYYDMNNRVLISGDSIQKNGRVFMFGPHRNLDAYVSSLNRLNERKEDFAEIWPSHSDLPLSKDSIEACMKDGIDLLNGKFEYHIHEDFGAVFRVYQGKENVYLADDK